MIIVPGVLAQADSAQAVTGVYSLSLLAMVPIAAAAGVVLALRRSSAEARVLVWRSAIAALLLVFIGRALPLHWVAWVMPPTLAAPLVALGRVRVGVDSVGMGANGAPAASGGPTIVNLLLAVYVAGVVVVLLPSVVGLIRLRGVLRRAHRVDADDGWRRTLEDARAAAFGSRSSRAVRVYLSSEAAVPMTWGFARPVIVLPQSVLRWSDARRGMSLVHELVHVRAADWPTKLGARAACALYWFHPAAWWLARRFRADCELACDGRVIASGARRSDYAELLVDAADALAAHRGSRAALALSRRDGLRGRLDAVLDTQRVTQPIARGWLVLAAAVTLGVSGPISAVQLAPTRDVLTTLMQDGRWESRAYAVVGLAQRADSVAVARAAAERDPSPRVRAWARYALSGGASIPQH
jgi:beta-lactamase regulating signal transducer with metallopeptidase domain